MSRVNVKVERGSTFYVHVRPSIFCLYFIYVRKIYVRTHVKIARQWKSTFIVRWVKCYWLIDENILGQVFGIPADFEGANDITNLPRKTPWCGYGDCDWSIALCNSFQSYNKLYFFINAIPLFYSMVYDLVFVCFLFDGFPSFFFFFCTASTAKQDAEDGPNISCPPSRNES